MLAPWCGLQVRKISIRNFFKKFPYSRKSEWLPVAVCGYFSYRLILIVPAGIPTYTDVYIRVWLKANHRRMLIEIKSGLWTSLRDLQYVPGIPLRQSTEHLTHFTAVFQKCKRQLNWHRVCAFTNCEGFPRKINRSILRIQIFWIFKRNPRI